MPIRPENRHLYPKDWKRISHHIRFERALGQCECDGRCGIDHGDRCPARHGQPHPDTGSKVVLTVMHLDHDPTNNTDSNLMAGCQRCHNRYDAPMRRRGIAERKPLPLFDAMDYESQHPEPERDTHGKDTEEKTAPEEKAGTSD